MININITIIVVTIIIIISVYLLQRQDLPMPILPFSFSPPLSPTTLTVINLLGPLVIVVIMIMVMIIVEMIIMMIMMMIDAIITHPMVVDSPLRSVNPPGIKNNQNLKLSQKFCSRFVHL